MLRPMKILFITTSLPGAVTNGGEQWSRNVIDGLRRIGADVTVIGFERPGNPGGKGEASVGRRTVETSRTPVQAALWGVRALLGGRPYTVQKWIGADYRRALAGLLARGGWTAAVIDHVQMAWTAELVGDLPVFHLSHHAEGALYTAQAERAGGAKRRILAREALLIAATERDLVTRARATWCVSSSDADRLSRFAPGRVVTLPADCRPDWAPGAATGDGPDVGLIGNWRWGPNRAALHWFLDQVCPVLPVAWRIEIAGAVDPAGLPQAGQVAFTGFVDDACAFMRRARRIAVPSLAEVGCNLKLLDAIAAARPVVASRAAIAALDDPPAHLSAADDAASFAAKLIAAPEADPDACAAWLAARRHDMDRTLTRALAGIGG